jgi:hypothetical protein
MGDESKKNELRQGNCDPLHGASSEEIERRENRDEHHD